MLLLLLAACGPREPAIPAAAWSAEVHAGLAASQRQVHLAGARAWLSWEGLTARVGAEGTALQVDGAAAATLRLLGSAPALGDCDPHLAAHDAAAGCVRVAAREVGGLAESWRTTPRGLEQRWSVAAPGDRVRVVQQVDVPIERVPGGARLGRGVTALWYGEPVAWDADSRPLPATLSVDGDLLVVEVDTAGARAPVTIDPEIRRATVGAGDLGGSLVLGSLAASDLDLDGFADLVVGLPEAGDRYGAPGAVVALRGGAGGLSPWWRYDLTRDAAGLGRSVTTGDLDGDGFDDLVVLNPDHHEVWTLTTALYVFRGGPAGLGARTHTVVGTTLERFDVVAFAGDLDGDGLGDVVASRECPGTRENGLQVLLGGPDASLTPDRCFTLPTSSRTVVRRAGDVDGDGLADLLVGSPDAAVPGVGSAGQVWLLPGGPTAAPRLLQEGADAYADLGAGVAAVDLDLDGLSDVLVAHSAAAGAPARVDVLHGPASAVTATAPVDGGLSAGELALGDVDGDGGPELAALDPFGSYDQPEEGAVHVWRLGPQGPVDPAAWRIETDRAEATASRALVAADFDGDAHADLAFVTAGLDEAGLAGGTLRVAWGGPDGPGEARPLEVDPGPWLPLDAAAVYIGGDLTGDGLDDLVVSDRAWSNTAPYQGRVWLYPGTPAGPSTTAAWSAPAPADWTSYGAALTTGDLDGDGDADLAVYGRTSAVDPGGAVQVWLQEAGTLVAGPTLTGEELTLAGRRLVAVDLDLDGADDLVFCDGTGSSYMPPAQARVFRGGPGGPSALSWSFVLPSSSGNPAEAAVGDIDGDGAADLLLGLRHYNSAPSADDVWWIRATPAGPAEPETWPVVDGYITSTSLTALDGRVFVAITDFDRRGAVYTIAGGVASPHIVGDMRGASLGRQIGHGDVDGDGAPDLVATTDSLTLGGAGVLWYPAAGPTPGWASSVDLGVVSSLALGDLNADGYDELVVAYEGRGGEGVRLWYGSPVGPVDQPCPPADGDGDGVCDPLDVAPADPLRCLDRDRDGADDCASGRFAPGDDGPDLDADGVVDAADPDRDGDGVVDLQDAAPDAPRACRDVDGDGCDDCAVGTANPAADGPDQDGDGVCDTTDPDDDADGAPDGADPSPLDPYVCGVDVDADACEDCAVEGSLSPTEDGVDADVDGLCAASDRFEVPCTGCADLIIEGAQRWILWGAEVEAVGDVDGDGVGDLLVGAAGFGWPYDPYTAFLDGWYELRSGAAPDAPALWRTQREHTRSATSGDVDGDGLADLLLGSSIQLRGGYYYTPPAPVTSRVEVYYGRPGGPSPTADVVWTWVSVGEAWTRRPVHAGDVDGDGRGDVAVGSTVRNGAGVVELLLGGSAAPSWSFATGERDDGLGAQVGAAGDVDGDGFGDLLVGASTAGVDRAGELWLFRGGPAGLEVDPWWTVKGDAAWRLVEARGAGDVDGDGFGDLLLLTRPGLYGDLSSELWRGGPAGLTRAWTFDGELLDRPADLDGDGQADLVLRGGAAPRYDEGELRALRGPPSLPTPQWWAGPEVRAASAAVADLDGDGLAELVVGSPEEANGEPGEGIVRLWRGQGGGPAVCPAAPPAWVTERAGAALEAVAVGDVHGDGYADLGVVSYSEGWLDVVPGGPQGLGAPQRVLWDPADPVEHAGPVGDFDGDGAEDVVMFTAAQRGAPGVLRWYRGSALGFGLAWEVVVDPGWLEDIGGIGGGGDLDGDGFDDLVVADPSGAGRLQVWRGAAAGPGPQPSRTIEAPPGASGFGGEVVVDGDVQGDGYADLLVTGEQAAWLLAGGPAGPAAPLALSAWELGPAHAAHAGDLDGDGYGDLAIATPATWGYDGGTSVYAVGLRLAVWRGGPAGPTFEPTAAWILDLPEAAALVDLTGLGDVDVDGYADLGLATDTRWRDGGGFAVLYGGPGLLDPSGRRWEAPCWTTGTRSIVGPGDVDGDGRMDVAGGWIGKAALWHGRPSRALGRTGGVDTAETDLPGETAALGETDAGSAEETDVSESDAGDVGESDAGESDAGESGVAAETVGGPDTVVHSGAARETGRDSRGAVDSSPRPAEPAVLAGGGCGCGSATSTPGLALAALGWALRRRAAGGTWVVRRGIRQPPPWHLGGSGGDR